MAQVVHLAKLCGWRYYHTFDSRRSTVGFPDLLLVHPKRRLVIFAELKTDRGKETPEQSAWLTDLLAAGQTAVTWRPKHWDEIQRVLSGGAA